MLRDIVMFIMIQSAEIPMVRREKKEMKSFCCLHVLVCVIKW